ncbi:MAG: PaaI family thioesterase [Deltaproteobacteria bacterium]|nr:PaaI family thioesterase [Deltaproteobacteria bacterium]
MTNLNPEFIKSIGEKVNNSPFYELTSIKLKEIAWGECIMEVIVQQKHLQPYGDEAKMITVEIKVNYLAPASTGRLIAKGKSIKVGRTLCLGEVAIENGEGKILAHGTATMMVLPDLEIEGDFDLPSKRIQPRKP